MDNLDKEIELLKEQINDAMDKYYKAIFIAVIALVAIYLIFKYTNLYSLFISGRLLLEIMVISLFTSVLFIGGYYLTRNNLQQNRRQWKLYDLFRLKKNTERSIRWCLRPRMICIL